MPNTVYLVMREDDARKLVDGTIKNTVWVGLELSDEPPYSQDEDDETGTIQIPVRELLLTALMAFDYNA